MSEPAPTSKSTKATTFAPTDRRATSPSRPAQQNSTPSPLHAGNFAMQGMLRTGAPAPDPPIGGGFSMSDATRRSMEMRFGADFRSVRVHSDSQSSVSANKLNAQAYATGNDIYFAGDKYRPDTTSGQHLLAHELAHTIQQAKGGAHNAVAFKRQQAASADASETALEREADRAADRVVSASAASGPISSQLSPAPPSDCGPRVQRAPGGQAGAPPSANPASPPGVSLDLPQIPLEWAKEPGANDIVAVVLGGKMVALPASGAFVLIQPPKGGVSPTAPTEPLVTMPTIGKEGMVAVNVGSRMGFMLDAGGSPAVVFPTAMSEIRQSLGVTTFVGVAVTHIHDDHVRSFVDLVSTNRIRPEGLFYPAAFAVNTSAPTSTFARALVALQSNASLQALGHGAGAHYQAIPTPQGGAFFRNTVESGQATFEFYGLTAAFQQLQAQRVAGRAQRGADTASLLTRVSFKDSSVRVLYVGDLRGSDLTLFEQAMGQQAYQEMLQGVKVIAGFQHHMGALDKEADRQGLLRLIQSTYMKNGELDVVVQSADTAGGKFSLNRSLMTSLTGMGVNVHVAKSPQGQGAAAQIGTITYDSAGNVTVRGAGQMESLKGSAEVREQVQTLIRLNEAAEILQQHGRWVTEKYRYTDEVVRARDNLKSALDAYIQGSLRNVKTGEAGRSQDALNNASQQAQNLQTLRNLPDTAEEKLTPAYMESLREVARQAPYRAIIEAELAKAGQKGTISDEAIDALWEVDAELAQRYVGGSAVSRRERRRVAARLPGAPVPVGGRLMLGFMVVLQLAELASPLVQAEQKKADAKDILRGMNDINFWMTKGILPRLQGLHDPWTSAHKWVYTPAEVQQMIKNDELNYLVLLEVTDSAWLPFTLWASGHLNNYRDWVTFVGSEQAIRSVGQGEPEDLDWEYHCGTIEATTFGHAVVEHWVKSPQLTLIMRASARTVKKKTEEEMSAITKGPGADLQDQASDPKKYAGPTTFGKLKQAKPGTKQFKKSVAEPKLYTLWHQDGRTGFSREAVFYVFPAESIAVKAEREQIPAEYVVVGGADFDTYRDVYDSENRWVDEGGFAPSRTPNIREVLLARAADLEDAPTQEPLPGAAK